MVTLGRHAPRKSFPRYSPAVNLVDGAYLPQTWPSESVKFPPTATSRRNLTIVHNRIGDLSFNSRSSTSNVPSDMSCEPTTMEGVTVAPKVKSRRFAGPSAAPTPSFQSCWFASGASSK